jgi:hypothetical protein
VATLEGAQPAPSLGASPAEAKPSPARGGRHRRFALPAIVVASCLLAAALVSANPASAFDATYCGDRYTAAHDWCWYSFYSGNHSWTSNETTYSGGGSFDVCSAISVYPRSTTLAKSCQPNKPTGYDAYVSYCGSPTVADKDAGVGNTDNNQHTIAGYARTGGC